MSNTVIHTDADFNAAEYHLPGHVVGLRMNDPLTLASLFRILAHPYPLYDDGKLTPEFRNPFH